MRRIITGVLFLLLLLPGAFALGISPPRTEPTYHPGTTITLTYSVRGAPNSDIEVIMEGELVKYLTLLSPGNFTLDEKGWGTISANFTIPVLTAPGMHEALIGAQDAIPASTSTVIARVAILSQIWVRIPYPEKYFDFWVEAPNRINSGDVITLAVKMTNRGLLAEHVSGVIEIFDPLGNSVAVLPMTSADNIAFGESARLAADWPTTKSIAGNYRAAITVNYDEKSSSLTHEFTVGEMRIEILNINASQILKDSTAKIPITISSKWNGEIENVYATIDISKNGQQVTQLKTPSKNVGAWAQDNLETYWETKGLELGSYDASVTLHYADKTTAATKILKIVEAITEETGLQLVLSADMLVTIALLVVVFALAYAFMQKRKKQKGYYSGYYR